MNKPLLLVLIVFVVFIAGCVKENPTEIKFKNDVVTIENYFVSNLAPYEKGDTSIQFEIHNNGDKTIPYLEVDFFDTPGFEIVDEYNSAEVTGEVYLAKNGLNCPVGERPIVNSKALPKCIFTKENALESLDVRSITVHLKSTEDVSSPTPHTVSFAIRYVYFGSREVHIPVIDGLTKKQPGTELRQSDPSIGPIVLDIEPSLEREVVVGDKTIKEDWGVGGNNPLPFITKLKFKNVGTIEGKIKDVNISFSSVRMSISGLKTDGLCDFCDLSDKSATCADDLIKKFPEKPGDERSDFLQHAIDQRQYLVDLGNKYYKLPVTDSPFYSTKSILVPFDILVCTFKPTINQPEYSAIISAYFAYKYEFIKSQDFVIQPLPEAK